jgi:hypothetical protein
MADQTNNGSGAVDGFSDNNSEGAVEVGSPDPGRPAAAPKPLSPEEYEKLKEEARENE